MHSEQEEGGKARAALHSVFMSGTNTTSKIQQQGVRQQSSKKPYDAVSGLDGRLCCRLE